MEASGVAGSSRRERAVCRYCAVSCGVFMDIEDGRVVGLIGDKDDPAYHGYTCRKGRDLPSHLYHPNRLLHPMRRSEDGTFEETPPETAVSEIAGQIGSIVAEHGPASVALYSGTYALPPPASMLTGAFMHALGSPMSFGCGSIDQPGKIIANALHGHWRGGAPSFEDADVWLFVGTNPLVSKLGGIPNANPAWHLKRGLDRGVKIIVIDPRRSDIAKKAAVHVQPMPGEDAVILAGMIRIILEESLFDRAFVDEHTRHIETLREQVQPFTPEFVEARADVSQAQLLEAARLFASAQLAGANAGTGVNMAPRGTLTEYLLRCLLSLCGFWAREGDPVRNPGVLVPRGPFRAQAARPRPGWGFEPKLRVRGLSNTACGLPTGALPDEILLGGEGQIRALICMGGNPMMAWPDQIKTREALESLDLLVVVDPKMTQTAQLADYVIAPKLPPEIPSSTYDIEELQGIAPGWGYALPYAAYGKALIDPPAGSALLEDWEFLYLLGREMGLELKVLTGTTRLEGDPPPRPVALDMEHTPNTDDLFDILTTHSRIPMSEVRKHAGGRVFEVPDATVQPRDPESAGFLELADATMMSQLADAARGPIEGDDAFPFRLVSRRPPNTMNSQGRDQPKLVQDRPHNPAFMNPADLESLSIDSGTLVTIESRRTAIHAVVEASSEIRRGVISMSHSYGLDPALLGLTGRDDSGSNGSEDSAGAPQAYSPQPYSMGGHTGALASAELDYVEAHSGIPRMSAIPVHVVRVPAQG